MRPVFRSRNPYLKSLLDILQRFAVPQTPSSLSNAISCDIRSLHFSLLCRPVKADTAGLLSSFPASLQSG